MRTLAFPLLITVCGIAHATDYADAANAADRPAELRKFDATWKPAEVLAFLRLEQSMTALDIIADGGYYSGDPRAIVNKLHRIDPGRVRADFEHAGFVFEGLSNLLDRPDDDHTINVFDPAIRGKTDKFVCRFRKPQAT